ncbi:MAG: CDP-diacylglycerol--glycerol-3-phosphate 3-phosphatidyltransferase [Clostridiales bacterium]|jgi:CDP-diacylglycerol--glycerol-3-phosphate 3-phosphatidyltransferase/cardiolipin synthase|nr:CDP-diacylglycerol--glycerol-3-phosphate 3-phosphatidyltransferase [Clostridiales bacterium]MBR5357677.1 CDP-diacylglycerol--glycerol-3-phosphate 3-phosphatidyltransferase [Clostridiales bacterium]
MNLPNKLSLLRIILVPFTMLFMLPVNIYGWQPEGWNAFINSNGMTVAAAIFIIASLTDMADGKIARKYNLITDLGKFLDSLADKILVISIMLALVYLGRLSPIMVMIIILREFAVSGLRMIAASKGEVIAARMIGKVKTVTQMVAIIYIMFEPILLKIFGMTYNGYPLEISAVTIIGDVLFDICVIMTIVSGIDYIIKGKKYLKG